LSGVIAEQLFAGTMLLTHDYGELGLPEAVVLAEPAVLEALRVSESISLPLRRVGATRHAPTPNQVSAFDRGDDGRWRKKMLLSLGSSQRRWPCEAAGSKSIEVLTDAGSAY
jgi:hypothetical protein